MRLGNGLDACCAKCFVGPLDSSACLEAREGKSSPNSQVLAIGKGNSARLILDLFMEARILCRLKMDNCVLAEPSRQSLA